MLIGYVVQDRFTGQRNRQAPPSSMTAGGH
jgi:hypothetical protein